MSTSERRSALPSRRELLIVALLVAAGLGVRVWRMSGVTLDHFDEGVYAFSALGLSDSQQPHVFYPSQEIFSPPLYFGLGGMIARVFHVAPDRALLMLSILFGTLTVLAVWWIARQGFGVGAGLAAAAIISFSSFHITFSRSALTDITFAFWLLVALAAIVVAIERQSMMWGVIGGLATGLAWNTKYHGWFALLITAAALVPYLWRLRAQGGNWRRPAAAWTLAAVTAFLCYLPWLIYLRSRPNGYRGMAAHYLGMLRSAWLHNTLHYADMLAYFEDPLSRVSVALAAGLALVFATQKHASARRLFAFGGAVVACALLLGSAGTTFVLSLAAVPLLLKRPVSFRVWTLLAWLGLWIVAAPVYRPYARLLLPFAIATAIAAGVALAFAAEWVQAPVAARRAVPMRWAVLTVLVIATTTLSFAVPTTADPWPRERGMGTLVEGMEDVIPAGSRVISVIETTPAYYLHRAGRPAFERTSGLVVFDTLSTPAYVITGTYVRRSPRLRKQLDSLRSHFTALGTFAVRPYDVRILDDLSPEAARRYRIHPDSTFDLHLWHFQP